MGIGRRSRKREREGEREIGRKYRHLDNVVGRVYAPTLPWDFQAEKERKAESERNFVMGARVRVFLYIVIAGLFSSAALSFFFEQQF